MINRHEFEKFAKQFRSGRISLSEFTAAVFELETEYSEDSFDNEIIHLRMPVRPSNSHKGDFGRVLFIGGSREMPGAIALSALAALRMGSGLVTVVVPDEVQAVVASYSPCLMTVGAESKDGFFSTAAGPQLIEKCDWADVVAVGPGMGRSRSCQKIVRSIYRHLAKPVILDADAINNLADRKVDLARHAGERILTPHPGEFNRLTHRKFNRRSEMEEHAIETARRTQTVVLLKGPRTIVTDGTRIYNNETGNEGMATAGSGDVLTGVIASLVGQKMNAFESAQNGCYLHGLAGDIYAQETSAASLLATDLIEQLPTAMQMLAKDNHLL